MQSSLYAIVVLGFFTLSTCAQTYVTPAPRRSPSCALLDGGKIHCFGGQTGTGKSLKSDATLFTLDTTKIQEDYTTHWEQITNSVNSEIYTTYPRARALVSVTTDKKNMIITGGHPSGKDLPFVHNIVYNVDTKTWSALSTFDDGVNGKSRSIYVGASTWVPEQSKVYFFGGTEINTPRSWFYDSVLGRNLTDITFAKDNSTSKIGYYRMTTLDMTVNASSSWQVPAQQNPPLLSYYMQSSFYHPSSKKIFYIGGLVNNVTTEQSIGTKNVSMTEALTYDTVNNIWGIQTFSGDLIPTSRRSHTVTLLPSGEDILLYGGTLDDQSSSIQDFCYTANLETFIWKSCNTISLPDNEPPFRTEHAAVLDESKNLVYILFGYQDTKYTINTFNTVLILNVTNPQKIEFVNTSQNLFTAAEEPSSTSDDNTQETPSSKNNNGPVIGGAIGGSAAVLLVIGAIALLIIRKKRADKKKILEQQNKMESAEHLAVDWDAIEAGYIETSSIPVKNSNKKELPIIKRDANTTNTAVSTTVPDANINEKIVAPDGGALSELITKPDVLNKSDE